MISRTLPSPARLTLTIVALAALPGLWTPLTAQTLTGRVLDEVSEAPVIGVLVTVLDEDGDRVLQAESDSVGRYRLRLPWPGAYRLATERLGYERGETPLLDVSFERGRALDEASDSGCATIVIDGNVASLEQAAVLPPQAWETMVVLMPAEAALLTGTGSTGLGAVLLFSRGREWR